MFCFSSFVAGQSLNDYLGLAAENNPGLQSKHKEFEAAMEMVNQARSLPDPNFSVGYFISPVETRVGPQQARFSLSQMFPWFGTLRAKGNASALMAEAKYQAYLDARNVLFFQVQQAFYPIYERQMLQAIQEDNLRILRSYKEIALKKFEGGDGSLADVIRTEIMIKDIKAKIDILKDQERPLLIGFNNLLNRAPSDSVVISDSLDLHISIGHAFDSTLAENPRLKEIDLKIKAMKEQELLAVKQGLPKLGVGLDYVLVGDRTDLGAGMTAPEDNGKNAFMPMVTVSVPIFRKKYKSAQKEAQLMQEAFELKKEETVNGLNSAYEESLFNIRKQQRLIEVYEDQTAETQEVLDLLYSTYSNSGKDFEELLKMQQQLLQYELSLVTAQTTLKTAEARLNYILSKDYIN